MLWNATPFRDFTEWCTRRDNETVKIQDVRRDNLRRLIADRHQGNVTAFAESIGKRQSQLADTLDGRKSFGEKVARAIEASAGLVPLSLDAPGDAPLAVRENVAAYGVQVSKAALLLAAEIEKLDAPLRAAVQILVEGLVAKQRRGDKPAPAKRVSAQPNA